MYIWLVHVLVLSPVRLCDLMDPMEPKRPLCPWNSPGKYWTGLPFLLQGIFPTQRSNLGLLHCRQILYHVSHVYIITVYVINTKEGMFPRSCLPGYWGFSYVRLTRFFLFFFWQNWSFYFLEQFQFLLLSIINNKTSIILCLHVLKKFLLEYS